MALLSCSMTCRAVVAVTISAPQKQRARPSVDWAGSFIAGAMHRVFPCSPIALAAIFPEVVISATAKSPANCRFSSPRKSSSSSIPRFRLTIPPALLARADEVIE